MLLLQILFVLHHTTSSHCFNFHHQGAHVNTYMHGWDICVSVRGVHASPDVLWACTGVVVVFCLMYVHHVKLSAASNVMPEQQTCLKVKVVKHLLVFMLQATLVFKTSQCIIPQETPVFIMSQDTTVFSESYKIAHKLFVPPSSFHACMRTCKYTQTYTPVDTHREVNQLPTKSPEQKQQQK